MIAALCIAATLTLLVLGAPEARAARLVWCLDERTGHVARVSPSQCRGREVDQETANAAREARRDRVRRALNPSQPAAAKGRRLRGTGTGFFVDPRGFLVTSHHVVEGCRALSVLPPGRAERDARLRAAAKGLDLALLDAGASVPTPARLARAHRPAADTPVSTVGFPNEGLVRIKPRRVGGRVDAALGQGRRGIFAMRIDVRRGNSGGPVLDASGDVLGVVFAKVDTPAVYADTGKLVRDVGYAIDGAVLRQFLARAGVRAAGATSSEPLDEREQLTRATRFVARVHCWK